MVQETWQGSEVVAKARWSHATASKDGDRLMILLAGGTKKRRDADMVAARRRWCGYKRRKRQGGLRQRSIGNFREHLAGFFEHGTFFGYY
jgi:hypothetical protein